LLGRLTVARASNSIRTMPQLLEAGLAPARDQHMLEKVAARYAVAITPDIAALIDTTDPDDPIARQFVPDASELDTAPQERADPLGEAERSPVPGLVHRYADRVLLKLTHVCPVYCRFCFRRETVGPGGPQALSEPALAAMVDYISARSEIWEVILTGGDPFMLSPRRIAGVTGRLAAIPHLKVLRWHTRVPVAEPGRVTPDLVDALTTSKAVSYVAVHVNHARELTAAARAACARIVGAGIPLLGQTVLLRGVNDSAQVLCDLMRACVEARIKPYYLHHPDPAPGTSRFRLSIVEGQAIVRQLRGKISGLAQPTYVLDIPGGHGKVPVGPSYLLPDGRVADPAGGLHDAPDRG
jgi:lysine 2,3-aminomutase